MAQKNKTVFSVRIDEEMYKKMLAVAKAEGRDLNNHMLHLIRTNIAYHERVHGKIDISSADTEAVLFVVSAPRQIFCVDG